jgi:predicted DNA-binding transcriptional regulator AlpA
VNDRVIPESEVARALGMSTSEFNERLPDMTKFGFPSPEDGGWRVLELLDWITAEQEKHLKFIDAITASLDRS